MSIRKFRYDNAESLHPGDSVLLSRDEEKHLFKILRAQAGDEVELLNGKGLIVSARVTEKRTLKVTGMRTFDKPARRIHLYLAPPRRQKMDVILHQAAELGVWRIIPMSCGFGVSEPDEKSLAGHWKDALFEACKQSGNPFLPEVTDQLLPFAKALENAKECCSPLFYGSTEENQNIKIPENGDLAWFVGPEGGFTPDELDALKQAAVPIRIGRWILRVETAAAAGIVRLS